jgi:chromosomal replication initiation ATPase DnaA
MGKAGEINWARIASKFVIPQAKTLMHITRVVEQAYDYSEGKLRNVMSNEPKYVHARYICFYLCRLLTPASYHQLGRYFNADHTTIINGSDHVKGCMKHSRELLELVQSLVAQIKSDPKWFQQ